MDKKTNNNNELSFSSGSRGSRDETDDGEEECIAKNQVEIENHFNKIKIEVKNNFKSKNLSLF
jgi:hypothetical protein